MVCYPSGDMWACSTREGIVILAVTEGTHSTAGRHEGPALKQVGAPPKGDRGDLCHRRSDRHPKGDTGGQLTGRTGRPPKGERGGSPPLPPVSPLKVDNKDLVHRRADRHPRGDRGDRQTAAGPLSTG